jgi:hypothetical protein
MPSVQFATYSDDEFFPSPGMLALPYCYFDGVTFFYSSAPDEQPVQGRVGASAHAALVLDSSGRHPGSRGNRTGDSVAFQQGEPG